MTQPGGSGSDTFCSAIRCWNAISSCGSRVSSIEKRSARASTCRESWLETVGDRRDEHGDRQRDGGTATDRAGAARRQPLAQAGDGEHPERRHDRQVQETVRDVVVVHVPELVRDHALAPRAA